MFPLALPLSAAETGEVLDLNQSAWQSVDSRLVGKKPAGWVPNTKFPNGKAFLTEVNGKMAFKLEGNSDTEKTTPFQIYYRHAVNVKPGDVVVTKGKVRGSGEYAILLYCYDENDKSIGSLPEKNVTHTISATEFEDFEVSIPVEKIRRGAPSFIRYALGAGSGSNVEFLDLEIKIIRAPK